MYRQPQSLRNVEQILRLIQRTEEQRFRLCHHYMGDLPLPCMEFDRKKADVAFLHQTGDAIGDGNQPELGQHIKCPQHRMSGKRNLLYWSKNPEANDCSRVCRRQHEHGLGEIHLPGNLLQLIVGETLRIGKHGDRVAAERLPGEHIGLIKFKHVAVCQNTSLPRCLTRIIHERFCCKRVCAALARET